MVAIFEGIREKEKETDEVKRVKGWIGSDEGGITQEANEVDLRQTDEVVQAKAAPEEAEVMKVKNELLEFTESELIEIADYFQNNPISGLNLEFANANHIYVLMKIHEISKVLKDPVFRVVDKYAPLLKFIHENFFYLLYKASILNRNGLKPYDHQQHHFYTKGMLDYINLYSKEIKDSNNQPVSSLGKVIEINMEEKDIALSTNPFYYGAFSFQDLLDNFTDTKITNTGLVLSASDELFDFARAALALASQDNDPIVKMLGETLITFVKAYQKYVLSMKRKQVLASSVVAEA